MTARLIFEATLIELNKIQAPALKLHEFNYLFNKSINQFVNKIYNLYDINLQTTDDLRVLKSTVILEPTSLKSDNNSIQKQINKATYEIMLPLDYLHLLNCICVYEITENINCWNEGDYVQISATRLTADSVNSITDDIYNRPSPLKPYYYIHNVNNTYTVPTNTYNENTNPTGTDRNANSEYDSDTNSNFPRTFSLSNIDLVNKPTASRNGNALPVRCEIRYGNDDTVFKLKEVWIDYIKVPQYIRLTQEQLDLTIDTSLIMEFPDYINQEIINELVHLIMERSNDPRLSNNILMTQSIARPTEQ